MTKYKKVGLVFCEEDVWNRYNFQKENINLNEFKNKNIKALILHIQRRRR